jgi:GNAT superfamily N-acetyltransferase
MTRVAGQVRVRRAVPTDMAELVVLIREFYEIDQHPFDASTVDGGLAPLLACDRFGQVWVVDGPTGPLGYAVVTFGWSVESGGRDSLLDEIYVRDRGSGVGRELLSHAMAEAAKAGASRMFLETEAHNSRVRGFYARLGFVVEDSVWMAAQF